jgi:hypothetical protein
MLTVMRQCNTTEIFIQAGKEVGTEINVDKTERKKIA